MILSNAELLKAVSDLQPDQLQRGWSIREIAQFIGEKQQRVKSHFDRYQRTIFPPKEPPESGRQRLYSFDDLRKYIIFRVITGQLPYRHYHAEDFLKTTDINVLWKKYRESVTELGTYLASNHKPA